MKIKLCSYENIIELVEILKFFSYRPKTFDDYDSNNIKNCLIVDNREMTYYSGVMDGDKLLTYDITSIMKLVMAYKANNEISFHKLDRISKILLGIFTSLGFNVHIGNNYSYNVLSKHSILMGCYYTENNIDTSMGNLLCNLYDILVIKASNKTNLLGYVLETEKMNMVLDSISDSLSEGNYLLKGKLYDIDELEFLCKNLNLGFNYNI